MNNKKLYKTIAERGGLMIEALAMLGLIAVVTPTMYKKSAERTLEVEDINTAGVMRTYMGALDAYIAANYADLMDKNQHPDSGGAMTVIPVNAADLVKYLPYNYDTTQSLYEFTAPTFKVVRRSNNLTAFALFPAKSAASNGIGQERTARIAALVGSNGGYVTNSTNNLNAVKARGVGGIWKLEDANYATVFNGESAPKQYSIVISSSNVVNGDALGEDGDQTKYLQRTKEEGEDQEWRNTMRTDLYLGGKTTGDLDDDEDEDLHSIRNVNSMIIGAEKVTDGDDNELNYGLFINKTGTNPNAFIGGTLEAAFNEANNKARFLVSDGDIDMNEHVTTDNISGLYSTAPGEITVSVDGKVRVNEELIAKQVDTGKVRATELAVGSDKIDDTNKWLKVGAEGIQVNGMLPHNGVLPTIYTTAGITNGNVEIKTKNYSDDSRGNEFVLNDGETSRTAGLKSTGQNTYYGISTEATDVSGKTTGHVALESGDWKLQISGSQTASDDNKMITAEFGDNAKTDTAPMPAKKIDGTIEWGMHDTFGGAKAGTVFVRKGMLAVTGDKAQDRGTNNKPTSTNAADDGTGIVMANRFVANNLDKDGNLVEVPDLLTSSARTIYGSGDNRYDTYMVNPAYTSVMNDIKLTTRGGARLSDILPDFITKGIYVATNSKDESTSLTFNEDNLSAQLDSLGKSGDGSLTSSNNYASPYTGVVPAPPCPPGYSRVITVTPSSFQMAQAGSLNLSNTNKPYVENKNLANAPSTLVEPEYNALELKSKNSGTISGGKITIEDVTPPISNKNVSINNATLADNMMKLSHNNKDVYVLSADQVDGKHQLKPLVFQQSTWLKSLVVPIKTGKSSSYGNVPSGGYTRGWAVLMGFLYPANEYTKFTKTLKIDSSGSAYWNIFPVKKYTLEGYATTYCYFDRDNAFGDFKSGYDSYVDKYDVFENTTDFKPYNKAYRQNLNDPSLKYDELW